MYILEIPQIQESFNIESVVRPVQRQTLIAWLDCVTGIMKRKE